eukprot:361679-Chlamydomonas_euryale.AAC.3
MAGAAYVMQQSLECDRHQAVHPSASLLRAPLCNNCVWWQKVASACEVMWWHKVGSEFEDRNSRSNGRAWCRSRPLDGQNMARMFGQMHARMFGCGVVHLRADMHTCTQAHVLVSAVLNQGTCPYGCLYQSVYTPVWTVCVLWQAVHMAEQAHTLG